MPFPASDHHMKKAHWPMFSSTQWTNYLQYAGLRTSRCDDADDLEVMVDLVVVCTTKFHSNGNTII